MFIVLEVRQSALRKKPLSSISKSQLSRTVTNRSVAINDTSNALFELISLYTEDVKSALRLLIEQYASLIIDEIARTAPLGTRATELHLRDSFFYDTDATVDNLVATIFSPEKGHITHFLEFGTIKMPPQPFMRKAYQKYVPEMQDKIKKIIQRGG